MNLQQALAALAPTKHKFTIEGIDFYIHRAKAKDVNDLSDLMKCVSLCTCDENGDPIFSLEDIEGRINLNVLDSEHVAKIYIAIMELYKETDVVDEVEKK